MSHISEIKKCLLAAGAATLMLLPAALSANDRDSHHFSTVKSPVIPHSVEFAGQKINLDDMMMAERYDRELTSLAYTHGTTLLIIKRANQLFPILAPILKKNGIPEDLLYLACIESSLNPFAISPAKAAGLWQFMPATGREYGLEVSDEVDERYHITKSTDAACRYFKKAYDRFGRWESVAASYNAGQGRISRELADQQVESAFDLWLVPETSRYMFRLMATKEIMEHPRRYGYSLTRDQLYQPYEYREVQVDSAVTSWPQWAREQGIDYLRLRLHNPWIRAKKLTNANSKTYTVLIPTEESQKRSSSHKSVYNHDWIDNRK